MSSLSTSLKKLQKRQISKGGVWTESFDEEFLYYSSSPSKKHIEPEFEIKTAAQQKFLHLLKEKTLPIVVAIGPAGSGKTHLGLHAGIQQLKQGRVNKLIVTRPAVSADEDIGFLPGTLEEKMDPYLRPIFDILHKYYSVKDVKKLMEDQIIEISPLAYMRGRTFTDSWIIADEMQNATASQVLMIMTRLGENAKLVVTGDLMQTDRKFSGKSGLMDFVQRYEKLEKLPEGIRLYRFSEHDVVRSAVVRSVLQLYATESHPSSQE